MPGSPPSRTTLPGTMPPPATRPGAHEPLGATRAGAAITASKGVLAAAATPAVPRAVNRTAASVRLFQASHAGQRPCHFGASEPQEEQMKCTRGAGRCRWVAMGHAYYRTDVR